MTTTSDAVYGVCKDCQRLQEVEFRADPSVQLCDNCAFRPDSPERAEPWTWLQFYKLHIGNSVPFHCHKGLPMKLLRNGTVKVVENTSTVRESRKKPCAGWLAHRRAQDYHGGESDAL